MEKWRDVQGFEGRYEVSDLGRIRNSRRGSILRDRRNSDGYARAALYKDGKYYHRLVHRLVAEAFIPNPENLPLVCHGPNGPSDNSAASLKWGTHADNQADRVRDGTVLNKTHCRNGHEYTDKNTYRNPKTGHRSCKTCRYWHTKRSQERRRKQHGDRSY